MYLSSKTFYLVLSLAILAIGSVGVTAFTSSSQTTVAQSNSPAGKINLMPLSSAQSVRASETVPETPAPAPVEQPAAPEAVAAAPQPSPKQAAPAPAPARAPARTPAPKPVVKAVAASVQPAPAPAPEIKCGGGLTAEFLCLLNKYRASKGKGKLSGSGALSSVALGHSTWMSKNGTFSHVGVDGSRLGDRCRAAGITCRGENLAHNIGTAQGLLNSWIASPTHNANLLGSYSTAGMGVYGGYTTLLLN